MRKFDWRFDMGASAQTVNKVNKVQMGDGYVQRTKAKINNKLTNWSGTKTGDLETVINPILNFLDSQQGMPFLWVNPWGEECKYTCEEYSTTQRRGNSWQISLKFEQTI